MPSFIKSRGFKIILIFIFIFTAYKFYLNYQEINKLENRISHLEKSISLAKEERAELQLELKNINNPEYIERIARDELGLVKPGELLLIPVEEEEKKE